MRKRKEIRLQTRLLYVAVTPKMRFTAVHTTPAIGCERSELKGLVCYFRAKRKQNVVCRLFWSLFAFCFSESLVCIGRPLAKGCLNWFVSVAGEALKISSSRIMKLYEVDLKPKNVRNMENDQVVLFGSKLKQNAPNRKGGFRKYAIMKIKSGLRVFESLKENENPLKRAESAFTIAKCVFQGLKMQYRGVRFILFQ